VPSEPTAARLPERILAALCLAILAALLLDLLTFAYGRDQAIYAMVARSLVHGGMPYRDAWDFKPPAIFVIYAAARLCFGSAQIGIRLVEATSLAFMTWALTRLTRRAWGTALPGLLAATMAILAHVQLDFWHTAQPESFGGVVTVFALLALAPLLTDDVPLGANTRSALLRCLLAGALFGFAGLLKPPLAGGAAVVALVLMIRERSIAGAARPVGLLVLGGALPILLCAFWFWLRGALPDLIQVLFVFTPHYTAIGWGNGGGIAGKLVRAFSEWLTGYSSVLTVGLVLLIVLRPRPRERLLAATSLGIALIHVVGVALQGKFFSYHWGATWPVTALVASLGYLRAWEWTLARGRLAIAAWFVAVFGFIPVLRGATKDYSGGFLQRLAMRAQAFVRTPQDDQLIDRLTRYDQWHASPRRAVADFLRERVPPGRPIYIYGFEPGIYDFADRSPASRYIYDVPQRVKWGRDAARQQLMADLAARPPAAIVVQHGDDLSWVTGDGHDSAQSLVEFPALPTLLQERYVFDRSIDVFEIWVER
jgi:hypothetical protein